MSTDPRALLVLRRVERDSIAAVPAGLRYWFAWEQPCNYEDAGWYISSQVDGAELEDLDPDDPGEWVGVGDVAEAEALLTVIRRNREAAAVAGVTVEDGGRAG